MENWLFTITAWQRFSSLLEIAFGFNLLITLYLEYSKEKQIQFSAAIQKPKKRKIIKFKPRNGKGRPATFTSKRLKELLEVPTETIKLIDFEEVEETRRSKTISNYNNIINRSQLITKWMVAGVLSSILLVLLTGIYSPYFGTVNIINLVYVLLLFGLLPLRMYQIKLLSKKQLKEFHNQLKLFEVVYIESKEPS